MEYIAKGKDEGSLILKGMVPLLEYRDEQQQQKKAG